MRARNKLQQTDDPLIIIKSIKSVLFIIKCIVNVTHCLKSDVDS